MKIDIRQLKPEGNDFHFSESAEEMEIAADGVKFPSPIEVDITTVLTGDEIICQGEVYNTVEIECSRCLDIFDLPINSRLQFVIQMLDSPVGLENGEDDDDYEVIPKTQTVFDISNRVRDAIVLNLPLKPLCGEECRGLCPMCGVNLNERDCECTPDKADERWDALKDIFDEELD
ncbi:MAG: DUF177 domain-containing protein [candidate division Zixibacteria bacterium]|nr:DUF177 domain-containing protein [candidate division Zixibacteria bacterium]